MTLFRNIKYNHKDVVAEVTDTNSGQFLWVGFKKDTNGNCRFLKVSAHDPNQIYFDVNLAVEEIKKMRVSGSNLLIGVDHGTNYIYRYSVFNPLSTPTIFARPSGVIEAPVDVVEGGSALWWLFPGITGSEIAKIVKTNTYGTFQETITLQQSGEEIHNAKSITYSGGELWVVTYTAPAQGVRVFQSGGWMIQVTSFV